MRATDAELLQRWRDGDGNSGERLFDRYYDIVERFFINKVEAAVTDLVQETFVRCTAGRENIRDGEHFRMYVFGVAYNVLKGHIRTRYRRGNEIDIDSISLAHLEPSPSSRLARQREERLLFEAMRQIPIADQVIIELHYWENLNTEDLAALLGIPVGTARGRLQRARTRLAERVHAMRESHEDLETTIHCLDDWAAGCRRELQRYQDELSPPDNEEDNEPSGGPPAAAPQRAIRGGRRG